jgi:hypothetical protein
MKKGHFTAFLLAAFILTSCEFKCEVGTPSHKEEKSSNNSTGPKDHASAKTLNDIELNTKDVVVDRAFLSKDNGDLISPDNTVALGEKINLVINITEGWKENNGKNFIGASEVITTDTGIEILNSEDLFSAYDEEGIAINDAKVITLKARITNQPTPPAEYYKVRFRVWDKKGNGEITGSYKFHIR